MHIATMIEKAPMGGYTLSQVTFSDGETKIEKLLCCTTLTEVSMYELALKTQHFKEPAWGVVSQPQYRQPEMVPQQQAAPQPQEQYHEDPTDPQLAEKMARRIYGLNGNGVNAVVAFVFCTAVAFSFGLRSLVA